MISDLSSDKLVAALLPRFLHNLEGCLDEISSAIKDRDYKKVSEIAHRIKGSSSCYGYPSIASAADVVEQTTITNPLEFDSVNKKVTTLVDLARTAIVHS